MRSNRVPKSNDTVSQLKPWFFNAMKYANYTHYNYIPTKTINEQDPGYFKRLNDNRFKQPDFNDNNGVPC